MRRILKLQAIRTSSLYQEEVGMSCSSCVAVSC